MNRPNLRRAAAALLLTLACLPAGCAPSTTTASGKVSYQGKPVVWGSVTLVAADGTVHQAGIEPDGSYKVPNVPVGTSQGGGRVLAAAGPRGAWAGRRCPRFRRPATARRLVRHPR